MATDQQLPLYRVYDDPKSIHAVANTITASFADDPLIRWLRPLFGPWSSDDPNTSKWQYRRVQRAVADGIILRSAAAPEIERESALRGGELDESRSVDGAAGAVALLFPPRSRRHYTLSRFVLAFKLWLLDFLCPVHERGADEQRLNILMDTHDRVLSKVQQEYRIPDLWYLEVLAVHPRLQGRGLGRRALSTVLGYTNDEPVVLECTNSENVAFYERMGFEVVEEVVLADADGAVKLWFMLRQPPRCRKTD